MNASRRSLGGHTPRLFILFLSSVTVLAYSLPVMANEEKCRHYKEHLERVNNDPRWKEPNNRRALPTLQSLYERKIAEYCSPSASGKEAGSNSQDNGETTKEYLTTGEIAVRSGPGYNFSEVATLAHGKKVNVAGEENGWLRIVSKQDRPPGYIPANAAQPVALAQSGGESRSASEPEGTTTYVTTKSVTVRSGPGEHFSVAGAISMDKEINVAGEEAGWLKVISKRNKPPGYIPATAARSTALAQASREYRTTPEQPQAPAQDVGPKRRRGTQAATSESAPDQSQGSSEVEVLSPPGPGLSEVYREKGKGGGHAENCDAHAAHPADPERNGVQGVDDDNIPAEKAISECTDAVTQDPQNSRLLFQLGRSYWTGGQYENAIEKFIAAGELGHGGALAYLGDATLYGVAGIDPDPEEAKKLYQRAANAGFAPAAAMASEIVAGVKAEKQQTAQAGSGQSTYHRPKIIAALAKGSTSLDSGRMSEKEEFIYVASVLGGVGHACGVMMSTSSAMAFGIHLPKELMRRFGFLEAAQFNREVDEGVFAAFQQEGVDDGYAFASGKGCNGSEVKNFVRTGFHYFAFNN